MSTISATSTSTTPLSSQASAAAAQAAAQSALQEAAQSIIGGSTGNSTMDVQSLVSALVTAKVAGQTAALTTETTNDNTQISAFGQLSASLSGLQVALAPLFNGSMLTSFTATSSGSGITATAGSGAVAGSYSVDVSQIASAQSLTSGVFSTDAAQSLGSGTMTVSVGNQSMTLNVNASNDSLSGIAAAINSADNNPGLSATVITGSDGQHLVLSANSTGAANTINVAIDAPSGSALTSLAVATTPASDATAGSTSTITSTSGDWTQASPALDAEFSFNGTGATSASNTVTGVLSGVTLNLTAAAVDTSGKGTGAQTLTVAPDTSTEVTDISNFVTAYNAVISNIAPTTGTLTSFTSSNAAGSQGGPLLGDPIVNSLQFALGNVVSSSVSSAGMTGTLASLGITLQSDGTLSLDSTTLNAAVQNNPAQVSAVFNLTNGIAQRLNAAITPYTQTGGLIDTRTDALTTDLQSVTTQTNALTAYTQQLTTQYNNEFTALNTLMANTTSDSQYLTALFGGADSAGALATGASSS